MDFISLDTLIRSIADRVLISGEELERELHLSRALPSFKQVTGSDAPESAIVDWKKGFSFRAQAQRRSELLRPMAATSLSQAFASAFRYSEAAAVVDQYLHNAGSQAPAFFDASDTGREKKNPAAAAEAAPMLQHMARWFTRYVALLRAGAFMEWDRGNGPSLQDGKYRSHADCERLRNIGFRRSDLLPWLAANEIPHSLEAAAPGTEIETRTPAEVVPEREAQAEGVQISVEPKREAAEVEAVIPARAAAGNNDVAAQTVPRRRPNAPKLHQVEMDRAIADHRDHPIIEEAVWRRLMEIAWEATGRMPCNGIVGVTQDGTSLVYEAADGKETILNRHNGLNQIRRRIFALGIR